MWLGTTTDALFTAPPDAANGMTVRWHISLHCRVQIYGVDRVQASSPETVFNWLMLLEELLLPISTLYFQHCISLYTSILFIFLASKLFWFIIMYKSSGFSGGRSITFQVSSLIVLFYSCVFRSSGHFIIWQLPHLCENTHSSYPVTLILQLCTL